MELIEKDIQYFEKLIATLEMQYRSFQTLLNHVSKPLLVDDRGLANTLMQLRETLQQTVDAVAVLDLTQTLGEIKFIGKKLHQIEADIAEMKNEGIKKKVDLRFSCDGYELVKKKSEITSKNSDDVLKELLNTLTERERQVLIHRLGLLGNPKVKTFVLLGKIFSISQKRISQIYKKALRKLRHPSRRSMVEACMHKDLIEEVLGEL